MGPDGAIYIADWYNPIIQHGEVDFRDSRRDHTRGRIWRVTAKNRPLVPRTKLVGAEVPALLEALKAPEEYTGHGSEAPGQRWTPSELRTGLVPSGPQAASPGRQGSALA